jgi:hypothetical protein
MDHNPFVSRNNDLFIMLIAGSGMVLLTNHWLPMSVQQQFLVILGFGFLGGLFLNSLYQSIEWALLFTLGILITSLFPWGLRAFYLEQFPLVDIIRTALQAGEYSLFLLSSWIIAIPAGFMLQKLVMTDYYKRKTL